MANDGSGRDDRGTSERPDDSSQQSPALARESDEETEQQRINRNWNELLQELRVTQTGVQLLTGFLLTLPFQQRFSELDTVARVVYLVVVVLSATATALIIAPVSYHRLVFRQHEKEWLVTTGDRWARFGLIGLALAVTGVIWLVFDVVVGRTASLIAGPVALVSFGGLWWGVPLSTRRRSVRRPTP